MAHTESISRPHPPCTVQVSLDLRTIDDALHVARIASDAGVDWLEAGTPLMIEQGMAAVRALRSSFPERPIVCDFKVCDGGALFARLAAEAGANYLDVMAAAHDATLRAAVREADKSSVKVIADTMFCPDPVAAALRAQVIGVHMIGWHLGFDHRAENRGLRAIDGLREVLRAVRIPVQVVGGLSLEDAVRAAEAGAASVVIGGPLVPLDRGEKLAATLREVVARIAAVHRPQGNQVLMGEP
jgi:3-hexulose-6-phosphate synthase/6-phospho-3-hexuloisomerase